MAPGHYHCPNNRNRNKARPSNIQKSTWTGPPVEGSNSSPSLFSSQQQWNVDAPPFFTPDKTPNKASPPRSNNNNPPQSYQMVGNWSPQSPQPFQPAPQSQISYQPRQLLPPPIPPVPRNQIPSLLEPIKQLQQLVQQTIHPAQPVQHAEAARKNEPAQAEDTKPKKPCSCVAIKHLKNELREKEEQLSTASFIEHSLKKHITNIGLMSNVYARREDAVDSELKKHKDENVELKEVVKNLELELCKAKKCIDEKEKEQKKLEKKIIDDQKTATAVAFQHRVHRELFCKNDPTKEHIQEERIKALNEKLLDSREFAKKIEKDYTNAIVRAENFKKSKEIEISLLKEKIVINDQIVARLEKQLKESEEAVSTKVAEIAKAKARAIKNTENLNNVKATNIIKEQQMKAQETKISDLSANMASTTKVVECLQAKLLDAEKRITALVKSNEQAKAKLEEMKPKVEQAAQLRKPENAAAPVLTNDNALAVSRKIALRSSKHNAKPENDIVMVGKDIGVTESTGLCNTPGRPKFVFHTKNLDIPLNAEKKVVYKHLEAQNIADANLNKQKSSESKVTAANPVKEDVEILKKSYEDAIAKKNKTIDELSEQVISYQKEINESAKKIASLKADLELCKTNEAHWKKELAEVSKIASSKDSQVHFKDDLLKKIQAKEKQLKAEVLHLQEVNKKIKNSNKDIDRYKAIMESDQKTISALKEANEQLKIQDSQRFQKVNEMKKKIASMEVAINVVVDEKATDCSNAELLQKVSQLQNELHELSSEKMKRAQKERYDVLLVAPGVNAKAKANATQQFNVYEGCLEKNIKMLKENIKRIQEHFEFNVMQLLPIPELPAPFSSKNEKIIESQLELAKKKKAQEEKRFGKMLDEECPVCLVRVDAITDARFWCETCKRNSHEECALEWFEKDFTCPACRAPLPSSPQSTSAAAAGFELD